MSVALEHAASCSKRGSGTDFPQKAALFTVIALCVALPRAGAVIPALHVPLPAGLVLLHAVFWPMVFTRRWQKDELRLLLGLVLFSVVVLFAAVLGLGRGARGSVVLIDLATLLGQVPAFFVVVSLVRSPAEARAAMVWLSFSVAAASTYAVLQYYLGASVLVPGLTYTAGSDYSQVNLTYGQASRALSSYGDPNVFATALAIFLPGLCGYVTCLRGWTVRRGLALASAALGFLALVYCNSRAGYLGVAVGLVVLVWRFPRSGLWAIIVGLFLLWTCSQLGLAARVKDRLAISSSDSRISYPAVALEILASHPEGAGLGVQLWDRPWHAGMTMEAAGSVWDTYNSSYLHMLTRSGVLGVGVFIWLAFGCARTAWRRSRDHRLPDELQAAAAGLVGGFLGAQIGMLTNPFYQLPGGGVNLWLGLGLAYALTRATVPGPVQPATRRGAANDGRRLSMPGHRVRFGENG